LLIAQISDTHVKDASIRLFGTVDAYGAMARAVDRIGAMDPAPDVVIHSGDIANDGEVADYAAAAALLARLPMPVHVTLGNHDLRAAARTALGHLPGLPAGGRFAYAVEDHAVRIVALDSLVEGAAHGELGQAQLRWLDETLAARAGAPTLVMLHHPPFATGVRHMDRIGLADAGALAEVIARHRQVGRVLAGHVHGAFTTAFAGTIAMTAPGTAHQVVVDLAPEAGAAWAADPPGLLLHRFRDGDFTTVAVPVEPAPPHPFSDGHTVVASA